MAASSQSSAPPQKRKREFDMPSITTPASQTALPFLFDMQPDQRDGVKYIHPPITNQQLRNDGPKQKYPLEQKHLNYLYDLIELGVRQLGRTLEYRDIVAITEALNCRFYEDMAYGPPRGIKTIDSYIKRGAWYQEILQKLFPGVKK